MLSRSSAEAIGDVVIMIFAGAMALLWGLAIVAGLPLLLLFFAFSDDGTLTGLWLVVAWFVAIYSVVTALEVMKTPSPAGATKLLAATVLITITCPLLWLSS